MNIVAVVKDEMNENVKTQIARDFIVLSCEFTDIAYLDKKALVDTSLMNELGVPAADLGAKPSMYIVYKSGDVWPEVPADVVKVERDLKPADVGTTLDPSVRVGYYLKEQGRTGPSMTERYLGRAYPRGRGFVDHLMLNMWG